MTFIDWIIAGGFAWPLLAAIVGILTGRAIRGRGHHCPSPNHPTMRAHKQLADGEPLDPDEAEKWAQIEGQLRTPDTQESQ